MDYRDDFASKMGLPLSARFKHAEEDIERGTREVLSQHPTYNREMARGRALARLDALAHQRSQARSFIVTKDHNWRRKVEIAAFFLLIGLCIFLSISKAYGQSTTIRGQAKGTTVANTATVTANDANHNGMDVNVLNAGSGGTASSFGAAFPATGTAAGFSDGVNMLPATLDASGFLKINCAAGCVAGGSFADAAAFTFGTTTVSNTSFVVDDVATNTVAENSAGAARMNTNRILYMDISKTAANAIAIKVDGSAVTQPVSIAGTVAVSGPLTDTQLRASPVPVSLTSTTVTGTVAVSATQLPAALDGSGFLKVHEQGTATVSGTVAATQSGTWTVQPGNTANTTAWKVDGSAVTQPVSGTVAATQSGNWSTRGQDGAGNALTTNSTTYTAKFALDGNLLGTLGTAFTTAGKVDVKGADGDVFVRQATAANLNATIVGTLADNGVAAATNRVGTLPSVTQTSYENGTASTQGRNAALSTGTDGLLWTANLPAIRPASYTASAAIAASSTTDNCRMPGNASNTVLVTMVKVSGTQTTAGSVTVTINKRSTAGSGGTSANITVVPDDSNYAAGVSVPVSYTGTGPTVGTLVGAIDNMKVGFLATATASPQDIYILNLRQKPIVLRGTAENLAVNLGGAVTGGNMTCTFNWIETATITP